MVVFHPRRVLLPLLLLLLGQVLGVVESGIDFGLFSFQLVLVEAKVKAVEVATRGVAVLQLVQLVEQLAAALRTRFVQEIGVDLPWRTCTDLHLHLPLHLLQW